MECKYNLLKYGTFSVTLYFHYILESNTVLFTPQHLFNNFSYELVIGYASRGIAYQKVLWAGH